MKKLKKISLIITSLVGATILASCSINTSNPITDKTTDSTTTTNSVTTSGEPSTYNFKNFEWADDFSSASLVLSNGSDEKRISATISTNSTSATCTTTGLITYVANAAYDGKDYSDTKTKVIDKLAHEYDVNHIIWSWENDYSKANASIKCKNCDDIKVIDATISSSTAPATFDKDGKTTFTATITFNGNNYTDSKEVIIPATGYIYDYDKISWTWNSDYTSVDVIVPCTNDPTHPMNLTTTTIEEKSNIPATCNAKGSIVYEASIIINNKTYKNEKTIELPIDENAHDWNNPTYVWDGNKCSATRVCKNNESHIETETVTATYTKTSDATCSENEKGKYNVTFTNPIFESQEKEVEIPDTSLGHVWNEAEYVWSGRLCTASRTCKRDETHKESECYSATYIKTSDATCTENEKGIYRVSFTNPAFVKQEIEVEIPNTKLEHDYDVNNISWSWTGFTSATATIKCKNCIDEKVLNATITSKTIPATASEDGKVVYTATITFNGNNYTNVKEDKIPTTGYVYDYNNITWNWNSDYTSVEVIVPCTNASNHDMKLNTTNIVEVSRTPSTCILNGTATYEASVVINNITYKNQKDKTLPLGEHDYGNPSYIWNDDTHECTGTRICKNNSSHTDSETVTALYQVITDSTFESTGLGRYTATFTGSAYETQYKDVVIPKKEYTWNEPTYEWNSDNTKCTATRIAKEDSSHIETETVTATHTTTLDETCTTKGTETYTAVFTNSAFSTQTKNIDRPALGHDYQFSKFEWASDYKSAMALYVCSHNNSHTIKYIADISSTTTATCDASGIRTYTATYDGHTESKQVADAAIGHKWGTPTYTWNNDFTECEAIVKCLNDPSHERREVASGTNITSNVVYATETTTGYKKFTATFTDDIFVSQEKNITLYYLKFVDINGNTVRIDSKGKVVTSGGKELIYNDIEEGKNITYELINADTKRDTFPTINTNSNAQLTYAFRGWYDDGQLVSNIKSYQITKNTILSPRYIKYEIVKSIDESCNVGGMQSDGYSYSQTKLTVKVNSVNDGYVFDGIYRTYNGNTVKVLSATATSDVNYQNDYFNQFEDEVTYEVRCYVMPITIDDSAEGGSVTHTTSTYVGGTYSAGAVTSNGYSFMGFFDENNNLAFKDSNSIPLDSFEKTITLPLSSATYTAKWYKSNITIKVNDAEKGSISGFDGTSIYGETRQITAVANTGYTFAGWKDKNGNIFSEEETINVTFDNKTQTYEAVFESYALTLNNNNGSAGTIPSYDNTPVVVYSKINLTVTLNEGYTFLGWYSYNTETSQYDKLVPGTKGNLNYEFTMPKSNVTYLAKFEKYKLKTTNENPDLGDIVTEYSYDGVTANTQVALTVEPKIGYTFDGWYLNDQLLANSDKSFTYIYTMPYEDVELVAKFKAYTLTATPDSDTNGGVVGYSLSNKATITFNTQGTNAIPNQVVTVDKSIEYPTIIPEKAGYAFKGWYVDVACTELFDFNSTINSDMILYAGYEKMITEKTDVSKSIVIDTATMNKSSTDYYSVNLSSNGTNNTKNIYFTSYVDGQLKFYFRSVDNKTCDITIKDITTGAIKETSEANIEFSNVYSVLDVNKNDVICLIISSEFDCELDFYVLGNSLPEATAKCGDIKYVTPTNITAGNVVTLKANPKPGYTFVGWYKDGSDTPESTASEFEYTMTKANVSFEAKFTYYTVSLSAEYKNDDSGAGSLINNYNLTKVTVGDKVELRATLTNGYTFLGWFINGSDTAISTDLEYDYTMIANNINIVAKYTYYLVTIEIDDVNAGTVGGISDDNYVKVSFDLPLEVNESYDNQYVYKNHTITYPGNPTWDGHIFKGWYSDALCTEFFDFSKELLGDTIIYAGFYEINNTNNYDILDLAETGNSIDTAISLVQQGGGSDNSFYRYFVANTTGTYRIYYKNSVSGDASRVRLIVQNVTKGGNPLIADSIITTEFAYRDFSVDKGDVIYVQTFSYEAYTPKFTYYINDMTSGTSQKPSNPVPSVTCGPLKYENTKIRKGTKITLKATVNEGYTFLGWYKNDDITPISTSLTYNVVVGTDDTVTYTAKYAVIS